MSEISQQLSAYAMLITHLADVQQENLSVARKDALQPMQLIVQYWSSRPSKVDDFHVI